MEQVHPSAQAAKPSDSRQLLITLSGNEVIKVEALDGAGKRHALPDEDFATLVGDDDVEDLLPVLEEAYVAGFSDAGSDVFEDDRNEDEPDDRDLEQAVVRGVASRSLIRRGVRKLILGRLVKRELLRKKAPGQGAKGASAATSH
jgi:hypothetical protein